MEQAIAETDTLMARFRGLLRISELEDRQRRAGFVELDPHALLLELFDFYLPLAEDGGIRLTLEQPVQLPALHGDRNCCSRRWPIWWVTASSSHRRVDRYGSRRVSMPAACISPSRTVDRGFRSKSARQC